MPRLIVAPGEDVIGLDDAIERLDAARFDAADEEALAAQAPVLAALGRNRMFLAGVALRELEERCARQVRANRYSAQVVMLHRAPGWFMRACFWPAATDPIVRAGGTAPFFYGVAHDHDFSFLTVGHLGPGYWSDYWERDPAAPPVAPGGPAGLVPMGRQRLEPGRVLLYRASRDVHRQQPADALSVSVNILDGTRERGRRLQYRFDPEAGVVAGILSGTPLTALLPLAARYAGAEGRSLVEEVAARHASGWVRFRAHAALAQTLPARAARRDHYARLARDPDNFVAALANEALATMTAGDAWIDADGPAAPDLPPRLSGSPEPGLDGIDRNAGDVLGGADRQ